MDRWRGKLALVTGAASGIGAAITKRLLDAGVDVVGLDLNVNQMIEIAEVRKKLDGYKGGALYPMKCDLAKEENIAKVFDWVKKDVGDLHVLVNNAGVIDYTPIIDSNRATFERLIDVNLLAMASCTSKAVQMMKASKVEGHVFNINSVLGHEIPEGALTDQEGSNGFNLYPASKHAAVAMTQTVRRELSRLGAPIRITSISPGLVKTEISKHNEALKDFFDKVEALDPDDIADALIYALGARPDVQISEITVRRTGEAL